MSTLKFCPKCGNALEVKDLICEKCGTDLSERKKGRTKEGSSFHTDVEYAGFINRLFAWIIDIGPVLGLSYLILELIIIGFPKITWIQFIIFYNSIPFLIGFMYFWLQEAVLFKGHTLGKWIFRLKTVDEKSLEVTTQKNYAINNLTRGTFFFLLDLSIGLFKNAEDPMKRARYSQNLSKTVVIKLKKT